ncbi:MAG: hypothetical protein E7277_08215 [Lachnospiraceae bacterium]|nr:hypothetical protein [Lachnospiraceae bacterium]
MNNSVLTIIRESEKQSHIATYTNEKLYQSDSWLKKPIKTVDFLEIAIEKLLENAKEHKVEMSIRGVAKAIEDFVIPKENYDFILAVSALEHVESEEIFARKLVEIAEGKCYE